MGQNNKRAGISCARDASLLPGSNASRLNKQKIFAYMAVVICLIASFAVTVSNSLAAQTGEVQSHPERPVYVVFAIDASISMTEKLKNIADDSYGLYTLNESIKTILSDSAENKVGLAVWNTNKSYPDKSLNVELTNNIVKLKNAVNPLNSSNIAGGNTCLADGLAAARDELNNIPNDNCAKCIVLISDGEAGNCGDENDRESFCQIVNELKKADIQLMGFSGNCEDTGSLSGFEDITKRLKDTTKLVIELKFSTPKKEGSPWVIPPIDARLALEILGIMILMLLVALFLPIEDMRQIRSKISQIIMPSDNSNYNDKKTVTCRGDMMIKKSVTKSVIPNVITIDSNGAASEEITIEITLPTERCCIGAHVAFAIDCSASMYNSDRDRMIRKAVVKRIVDQMRNDSDRVAISCWKDGKIQNTQEITKEFRSVKDNLDLSLRGGDDNDDNGGTNFKELLTGALDLVYGDLKECDKPYTRSVIILSDAVPEGEGASDGLKFEIGNFNSAISERETKNGGEKVAFYSVGINPHKTGKKTLEDIAKLGDDKHQGSFVPIEEKATKDIDGEINKINEKISDKLILFEELKNIKIIDILPPYLKEPHDFKTIRKPISKRVADPVATTPAPMVETNLQSYTTTITWDLGTKPANGDIWKLTFKARLEFPIPTNMIAMSNENIKSQITYTDKDNKTYKISLDPGEIRFRAATE